jgi:VWFA-related protein
MRRRIRDSLRLVLLGFATLVACSHLIAQQTTETPAQDSTFTIKSHVNVALVPVLVRDKRGQEVGTLSKEDFQVFDNGKPQVISGFTIQKRAGVKNAFKAAPSTTVPPVSVVPRVTPPSVVPNRFIVFMFDDLHLSFGDLAQAQKAATKIMAASLTDTDMAAVVSISGRVNSGLTMDRAKLQEATLQLRPQGLYRMTGSECPSIDYYHADLIENKHNSNALEAAIEEVMTCSPGLQLREVAQRLAEGAANQALAVGEQDVQVTLSSVIGFVHRMALLPGQRTLVLISPGFLVLTPQALAGESQIMDAAAQSNVIISVLDARGLYTTEMDASERGGSTELSSRLKSEYRRDTTSLSENVMAELADGTGGTYFHNSNDLEGGFQRLTAGPEYMYLLEFSLRDVKQDGRYHDLKVKVDEDDLKVQARRGYFAPKPPKKKK